MIKKGWPQDHGYCGPYNKEAGCECKEYLKKKNWEDNKIGTYEKVRKYDQCRHLKTNFLLPGQSKNSKRILDLT